MQEHSTNVRILARVTQSACDKCNLGRDLTSVTMLNGPSCFVKTHVNNISCSQNNLTVTKQFNKQDNYILSRACYLKSAPGHRPLSSVVTGPGLRVSPAPATCPDTERPRDQLGRRPGRNYGPRVPQTATNNRHRPSDEFCVRNARAHARKYQQVF